MRTDAVPLFLLLCLGHAQQKLRDSVEVDPDTGCWLWKRSGDGRYGHFYIFGVKFKAHVASHLMFNGRIPRGHVVRHGCDRMACCCPVHLETGTQKQNCADASERGRRRRGLKRATVARIRNLITRGHGDIAIGSRVGCPPSTVWRIRTGKMR